MGKWTDIHYESAMKKTVEQSGSEQSESCESDLELHMSRF